MLFALILGGTIISLALSALIPIVLNYPEATYGTAFQTELENTTYSTQILLISCAIFAIFGIIIFGKTNFLIKYKNVIDAPELYDEKTINKLKEYLFISPYSIFLLNIIIPSVALTTIHAFTIHQLSITTLKLSMLVVSFITLYVTAIFIYMNSIFKKILVNLPATNLKGLKRTSIRKRIIFNIFPILAASILFIALLGYAKVAEEKANSSFEAYNHSLKYFLTYNEENFQSIDDFIKFTRLDFELLNENDLFFIRLPNGNFIDRDYNPIYFSDFFVKYLNELSIFNDGRVYEYYGIDSQSATGQVKINDYVYTVGVYFNVLSNDVLIYFIIAYFIVIIIDLIIILLFSNSFKYDITSISKKFETILEITDEDMHVPSTTNDEVGDLCQAYNEIQTLTKNNQNMLVEKERLASLGQMIGGIAHNLKTPIFSISGGLEGLQDLVNEFDESIEDHGVTVTDTDMHDIAKDMNEWLEKLKGYVSYMNEVITAVKGQAVTLSDNDEFDFSIEEAFKQVDILMKHELKNSLIDLKIRNNISNHIQIHGNINSLVQIINNIISNAIEAYNNEPGKSIDLIAVAQGDKIQIKIRDYGPGIPDEVKEKLFNSMITTKGKNGTGLGLFMSYSTIKANFHGNLSVETELGKGTTFIITLPSKIA